MAQISPVTKYALWLKNVRLTEAHVDVNITDGYLLHLFCVSLTENETVMPRTGRSARPTRSQCKS